MDGLEECGQTSAPQVTAVTELFGSFLLGADEFALPASSIREVVKFPARITPMPLSPAFLEGVFTLRGTVIPVINLGRIFDPAGVAANVTQTIAIIDFRQVQVGLLFDSTGEILRVRPEHRSDLQYRDSASHNVVAGTIHLDDGARLLQILDPDALISIENIPQVLALKTTGRELQGNRFHRQAERRQCVAFGVGGTAFAFEMHAIREIIEVPELKTSALASKLCMGRINLRGNAVAVVDFAGLLHLDERGAAPAGERRIMIARIGDASIGLLVDSVDNIFSFYPGDVLPIPLLSKARAGMFGGCISKEGIGGVIFLNHEQIFSRAEVLDITRGHTELYQQEAADDRHHVRKETCNRQRHVYITFNISHIYALEIRQIREIIDFSGELLQPPGMPDFVHGILNLRHKMITIIDLRKLYGMEALVDVSNAKILVIERGDERYGLMVDSVANIITVTDSERIPAPGIMRGRECGDLRHEMPEVIDRATGPQTRQTLSVFEIDVFLQRLEREIALA